jgi:hypothetical protein
MFTFSGDSRVPETASTLSLVYTLFLPILYTFYDNLQSRHSEVNNNS